MKIQEALDIIDEAGDVVASECVYHNLEVNLTKLREALERGQIEYES